MVWGDEMVIYQHQSGDTHLFGGTTKHILALCVLRESFSVNDLIESSPDYFNDRQEAEVFIASIVQSLAQKDLIVAETL